ncbi:putative nucleic-acid-binding protein [Dysgonomonadaceae bacterium PH5-43]|nr:putative nucleic-acid-binding protein [Dysgonomonadaceae bacterium PH5-43]
MKRILFFLPLLLALFFSGDALGQNKQLEKQRNKMYKSKLKEYKKEGWKLDASSKTIEVVLLEHYEKLKDENYQEIVGAVSNCNSINVCRQAAYNNAIITYANRSASTVKGRVASDINLNASDFKHSAEFDKFYAAYERFIKAEINSGVLLESYSIKKKSGDTNEYQIYFLINEDKALQARKKAMQRALEETTIAQEYAAKISDFINEGIKSID